MQHEMLNDPHEMTKRYSNTYVGCTQEGGVSHILVKQFFTNDDSKVRMLGQDGCVYKPDEINLTRPKLGAFNVGKSVVFITLPPVRQWKRGFVFKHAKVECRFKLASAHHRTPTTTTILQSIYNPEYPTVEDALKEVKGYNTVARAFSPKFYFGLQYNASAVLVFYKKWIVGYVNDQDEIMLKSHHLFEELSQYMKVRKVK